MSQTLELIEMQMNSKVRQLVIVVAALLSGWLPSFGLHAESAGGSASWVEGYRFRPLDDRQARATSTWRDETQASDAERELLAQGWRFRPLQRRGAHRKSAITPARPQPLVADDWAPQPYPAPSPSPEWRAPVVPLVAPVVAEPVTSRRNAEADLDVYVMFHGKRYRFRAPARRGGMPNPDPTSSYLGEDSLYAGKQRPLYRDLSDREGGFRQLPN